MDRIIKKVKKVSGVVNLPGDRSISHRALFCASLADGVSEIFGCSDALECEATKKCIRQLGIEINGDTERIEVVGKGIDGYSKPEDTLDTENSATALAILSGLLSGFEFESEISGGAGLKKRSYKSLIDALMKMGAKIESDGGALPLKVTGTHIVGTNYSFATPSPHVKSSLLMAALKAEGETIIHETIPSRDHTERMLNHFDIPLEIYTTEDAQTGTELDRRMKRIKQKQMFQEKGSEIHLWGIGGFGPATVEIPGDVTASAPFITIGTTLKSSNVQIK
ncbi:MAG: hypothetical protein GF307_13585, partial [candidate division Zixibacteria bacterium]|nr:hypothetical protein [candidate division Zixibacteria bacterium]